MCARLAAVAPGALSLNGPTLRVVFLVTSPLVILPQTTVGIDLLRKPDVARESVMVYLWFSG